MLTSPLIPAQAGIQGDDFRVGNWRPWIPAFAWMPGIKPGMTVERFYARALTHAPLIPAHAGIQSDDFRVGNWRPWTPAFAGVSGRWEPALAVTPPRF